MRVSDVQTLFTKLSVEQPSEFHRNGHKAFGAYTKHVSATDDPVLLLYTNIQDVCKAWQQSPLSPMTVRNYMRYLQRALSDIDEIKGLFDEEGHASATRAIASVVRQCDRAAKAVVGGGDVCPNVDVASSECSESLVAQSEAGCDLDSLEVVGNPAGDRADVVAVKTALLDARHEADKLQAQLDVVWRMLELFLVPRPG